MKDQIVMSKTNGEIGIAVPLFRYHYSDELANLEGYVISVTDSKPLAYVIDAGPAHGSPQLMNAKIVEENLEFLGDL